MFAALNKLRGGSASASSSTSSPKVDRAESDLNNNEDTKFEVSPCFDAFPTPAVFKDGDQGLSEEYL